MKTYSSFWRLASFVAALVLVASCEEAMPTSDLETSSDEMVGLKKGGKPGGGTFTNWAFAASNGSKINLMSFDGSVSTTIAAGGSTNRYSPRFTYDGKQVIYLVGRELRMVGVDGSNDRMVFDFSTFSGPWYGRFDDLPRSSKVIYNGYGDVAVVDTETGTAQWLGWSGFFPGYGWMGEVSAGPDLDATAPGFQGPIAVAWGLGVDLESDMDIYVVMAIEHEDGSMSLDPASIVRFPLPDPHDGSGHQNHPAFSSDGTRIAFQDKTHCCSGQELKVVDFRIDLWRAGERTAELLFDPSDPAPIVSQEISPALAWILYQPVWSPDGQWIAYTGRFAGKGPYTEAHLSVVNPLDPNDTFRLSSRLAAFHPDWNPRWEPDLP